ncbi:hypothetical protein THALO_70158 [Tenacibaculum halocynthiae]
MFCDFNVKETTIKNAKHKYIFLHITYLIFLNTLNYLFILILKKISMFKAYSTTL